MFYQSVLNFWLNICLREFIEKAFALKGFTILWKGHGINEIGYDNDEVGFNGSKVEIITKIFIGTLT